MICGAFVFAAVKRNSSSPLDVAEYYNNVFFALGVAVFIAALFIRDFNLQTSVIIASLGMIFFMFFSKSFVRIAVERLKSVDYRIYALYFLFQALMVFVFEKVRGVY
ncbi:MAG: hypothetical protein PHQ23_02585 [Candidatus Wallbacteria bacterium]|nr:hypothetical protein [Candidatus Wallbacteria bacterium]